MTDDNNAPDITMKLSPVAQMQTTLHNPKRIVTLVKLVNHENHDKVYWNILTSVPEHGPKYDREMLISDESMIEVIAMRNIIDLGKIEEIKAQLIADGFEMPEKPFHTSWLVDMEASPVDEIKD